MSSLFLSPASNSTNDVLYWYADGGVNSYSVNGGYAARPVLNLVSEAETIDGDGSFSNPYILNVE